MLCYMLSHEAHHRGQVTTLIVDDEPLAREGLRLLLLSEDPEISVIWEARMGGRRSCPSKRRGRTWYFWTYRCRR
jgi:hypothetical protein